MENNKISYFDLITDIEEKIRNAGKIILGIGAGLSAAGGLDYTDKELAKKWYPEYFSMGLHSISDIMGAHWFINRCKTEQYWGFWAKHINHIRYEAEATKPYHDLMEIIKDKDYFIITTNADSQVEKVGFAKDKIFAMQGNYCFFQCIEPCSDEVYYNEKMIKDMESNMPNPFEIRTEDIPKCPRCGKLLVPNLHCDNTFVETPHWRNYPLYQSFVEGCKDKNVVLLELGVGYNTPSIIRYPFEGIAREYKNAFLIRINNTCATIPKEISDKAIPLQDDLGKVLTDILAVKNNGVGRIEESM